MSIGILFALAAGLLWGLVFIAPSYSPTIRQRCSRSA
jgi:hypothetical protein